MAKSILLVDDSASLRNVVAIALRGAGYDVIEAADGREALSKLTGQKVHLIISDVNMPNMDGITLVKELKKQATYRFTPIMMLTTETQPEKKQAAREAGAKAWLVKPFQPPALLDAVSKLVLP
ncbi:response regulator [Imhoffiella purpurea]|uniref:response regulator n=1 Tax=Imhoffiella purpurea TaxID=1249627 RepID=UPI0005C2058C|nr:response regulator [Imhoffiella purpurea]